MTSLNVINLNIGVKGRFKLEINKPGEARRVVAEFDNLITNLGLDRIAQGVTTLINVCQVGSGNSTPATTDTVLYSYIASAGMSSPTYTNSGSPDYIVSTTAVYAFGQGAAAGNLSEIGISTSVGSGGTLTSRALILDGFGNPTTITVLSDEYLTVTYTLSVQANLSDVVQTVNGYTFTIRPALIGTSNAGNEPSGWSAVGGLAIFGTNSLNRIHSGAVVAVTGSPAGSSINCTSQTLDTYVSRTYARNLTVTWSPTSGALNINSFFLGFCGPKYQVGISPAIAKTTGKSVQIVFRLTVSRL